MKADAVHRASAPLQVALAELPLLPVRGQRRHALAADRTYRVSEPGTGIDLSRRTDVDKPQVDSVAQQSVLFAPSIRLAAAVTSGFDAVDCDPHLEAVLLIVRDLRLVRQVHIAHRERAGGLGRRAGTPATQGRTA